MLEDVVASIVYRLRSGEMPYQAIATSLALIPNEIYAMLPLEVAQGGEPNEVLVRRSVLEKVLIARKESAAIRCGAAASVSQAYSALGQVALAEMSLARAEDCSKEEGCNPLQTLHSRLSARESLYIARGEMDKAKEMADQLLSLKGPGLSYRIAYTENKMNMGIYPCQRGELVESLQILKAVLSDLQVLEAECYHPADIKLLRQVRSGCLANIARALIDATTYIGMTSAGSSEDQAVETLGGSDRANAIAFDVDSSAWMEVAGTRSPVRLLEQAEEDLRTAISLSEETGHSEYLAIQQMLHARVYQMMGRFPEVEAKLVAALRNSQRAGDQRHVGALAAQIARVAEARGDVPAQLDALSTQMQSLLRGVIEGRIDEQEATRPGIKAMALAALPGASTEVIWRALLIAESGKGIRLARSMRHGVAGMPSAGQDSTQLDALMAEREIRRQNWIWRRPIDDVDVLRNELSSIDRQVRDERLQMGLRDPRYATWHDATWASLASRESLLEWLHSTGDNSTLVSILATDEVAYAIAVWNSGAVATSAAVERGNPAGCLSALLDGLRVRLLALGLDDLVLVSPDASHDRISWAALLFDGRHSIEQFCVSVLPGIGFLEICTSRPKRTWRTAVCIGAPQRRDLPALDATRLEVEASVRMLANAKVAVGAPHIGRAANLDALRSSTDEFDILHLACHGELTADGSVHLMLSPDMASGESGVLDSDFILTQAKVASGALVVLAACTSAASGASGRFVQAGQVSAWLIAGASHVLASVREIGDRSSAKFIERFFEFLLQGRSPARALAHTQRAALAGELDSAAAHPVQWGAFTVSGLG